MGTPYAGFDTFTFAAQPATFGRFISGMSADDGDLDDAAHLMALAMAVQDNCQFIAWRTIDWVSGDVRPVGGLVTFTGSGINGIQFQCPVAFNGTHGNATFAKDAYVMSGATFFFGGNALGGAGHVEVDATGAGAGSDVKLKGGAPIIITGGGLITSDGHIVFNGTQPSVTTNPGANNAVYGANVAKSWAFLHTDGAGAITIDRGYNVASVTLDANGRVVATFVRAMANTDFHADPRVLDPNLGLAHVVARSGTTITIAAFIGTDLQSAVAVGGDLTANTNLKTNGSTTRISFAVFAEQ